MLVALLWLWLLLLFLTFHGPSLNQTNLTWSASPTSTLVGKFAGLDGFRCNIRIVVLIVQVRYGMVWCDVMGCDVRSTSHISDRRQKPSVSVTGSNGPS